MKQFPLPEGLSFDEELCTNKTFPFLETVRFEYHAHCCSYSLFKPLKAFVFLTSDTPEKVCSSANSTTDDRKRSVSSSRTKRSLQTYNCINLQDGTSVNDYSPNESEIYALEQLCQVMTFCFDDRCPENCVNDESVASGSAESQPGMNEIACVPVEEEQSQTVSSSMLTTSSDPSSTIVPSPTSTTTITGSDISTTATLCWRGTSLISKTTSEALSHSPLSDKCCTTIEYMLSPTSVEEVTCGGGLSSTTETVIPLPSSSTNSTTSTSSPVATSAPILYCDDIEDDAAEFEECSFCEFDECPLPECERFQAVCDADRRKRSTNCFANDCIPAECKDFEHLCSALRKRKNAAPSPFECSSCNVSIVLLIQTTPTTTYQSPTSSQISQKTIVTTTASSSNIRKTSSSTTPKISSSVNVGGVSGQPSPYCTQHPLFAAEWFYEGDEYASCYPGNDPFNPCFDILDDDVLRGAIWIVLLIAIIGNTTVITVTTLHWIFKYRSHKKEPNLLYVLYLNLAIADLFMGFYLITIAAADIDTKGHYSSEAVSWQTGHGCGFAGFCAIFSSVLSVYTLLVITAERVYSIKFALQKRHFKKRWVFVLISFGWMIAMLFAVLPLLGINNYERVSICLPFDNREQKDKVYIAFILCITGLATFLIIFSYIYLFYIVGCSASKRQLTGSLSGKEELKLALRMSLLVITDFICWAPIALFGLTAAFGLPLVNDIKFAKIVMVFIFPLNSCLNPILYSFSTRLFRNNILHMVKKCGLCKLCDEYRTSVKLSSTEKNASFDSSSDERLPNGYHRRRRSTQMTIISRLASISTISDSGSRRGSTFSGSSIEEGYAEKEVKTNGGMSSNPLSKTSWDSSSSLTSMNPRLKALPEEDEMNINHLSIDIQRKNSTGSDCSTSVHTISDGSPPGRTKDSYRRQSLPTILDLQEDSQKCETPKNNYNGEMMPSQVNGIVLTNRTAVDEEVIQQEIESEVTSL